MSGGVNDNYIQYVGSTINCASGGTVLGDEITIPKKGLYLVYASARNNGTPSTGITEVGIDRNGTNLIVIDSVSNEGMFRYTSGIALVPFDEGEKIRHRVYQNGGYTEAIVDRYLRVLKVLDL